MKTKLSKIYMPQSTYGIQSKDNKTVGIIGEDKQKD